MAANPNMPPNAPDETARPADDYIAEVYEELRRRARDAMASLPPGQTLQPTALVHEAYSNLVTRGDGRWNDEQHFLASATLAIRAAVVDRVRSRTRAKRGGGQPRVQFDEGLPIAMPNVPDETVLKVDELLCELAEVDARAAEVVTHRFFLQMNEEQVARVLGVSDRTVRRDWVFAKGWLMSRLGKDADIG